MTDPQFNDLEALPHYDRREEYRDLQGDCTTSLMTPTYDARHRFTRCRASWFVLVVYVGAQFSACLGVAAGRRL